MADPAEGPRTGTAARPRRATQRAARAAARARALQAPAGPSVAALITAHNQARRIAATVRAALAIPGVDLVLVVDDGSTDNTQDLARRAGAVVVRHSHVRGRTAAVETGASVIAMRDEPGRSPRGILFLDAGLGHYAIGAAPLVPAVLEGVCDLSIAMTEGAAPLKEVATHATRRAVERACGWQPRHPLGTIRCVSREALEASMPLARGAGLEAGMTLDIIHAGLTVTEIECEIRHKAAPARTPVAKANRYREVIAALATRRIKSAMSRRGDSGPPPEDEGASTERTDA
ncbi:glycosyltransferase family 2 protein [Demequina pelophila]|uniref:glycosyltransferase family 2 protein n=1 Tax=Demequina pelophila TaxID=1638984 RepID=UPI000AC160DB|nr:glycosyltransferase [Demequina pelophila]